MRLIIRRLIILGRGEIVTKIRIESWIDPVNARMFATHPAVTYLFIVRPFLFYGEFATLLWILGPTIHFPPAFHPSILWSPTNQRHA
jgi:hypothetical protein